MTAGTFTSISPTNGSTLDNNTIAPPQPYNVKSPKLSITIENSGEISLHTPTNNKTSNKNSRTNIIEPKILIEDPFLATSTPSNSSLLLSSPSSSTTINRSSVTSPTRQRSTEEILDYQPNPSTLPSELLPLFQLVINNQLIATSKYLSSLSSPARTIELNRVDSHGCNVLFFALSPSHSNILSLLLDYGANPDHLNNRNNTPLHIAAFFTYKKAIVQLIQAGASIKLENWEHQQPHQMPKTTEKVTQMQTFINQCNNINTNTNNNTTINSSATAASTSATASTSTAATSVPGVGGGASTAEGISLVHIKSWQSADRDYRSYCRSIFDRADENQLGVIPFESVKQYVRLAQQEEDEEKKNGNGKDEKIKVTSDNGVAGESELTVNSDLFLEWFRSMDDGGRGLISFPSFLHSSVNNRHEKEKAAKKGKQPKKNPKK